MNINHILIIGFVWPEPNSSAAGSRMLQLIKLFLDQKYKVSFASPAADSAHMIDLNALGISTHQIKINDPSFDEFLIKLQPTIVIFDRFMTEEQFGWRVAKHSPETLRILNTEDLHCLRKTRQEIFKKEQIFTLNDLLSNEYTKREIASIYRSDLSLIISDYEMDLLQEKFKIDKSLLFYLPFMFDPINTNDWPSFEQRADFITIGNFRHEPNWNSILYLKETIWPLIRQELPKAKINIYGAYPPPKATQLHNPKEGFYIQGWAKDAHQVLKNAKVCLAPLRFGAGIKGKLADAMLCGTPSVTTTIGAEGMLEEDSDWNGFVIDQPIKFANAAVRLYNNKDLWQQSQQNGIEIINTRFQKHAFSGILIEKIKTLQQKLKEHRSNNFTGSMLQHHTQRSTEYMSRWIEEKNKR